MLHRTGVLKSIGAILAALVCLSAASGATPAARSNASVEIEIPVRSGGYGTAFYEETARQFEKLRPGTRINLYGDPRIEDKVRVRIMGGDYPDAALAPYLLWPVLINAGRVRDLTGDLAGPELGRGCPLGRHVSPGGARFLARQPAGLCCAAGLCVLDDILQRRDVPEARLGAGAHLGRILCSVRADPRGGRGAPEPDRRLRKLSGCFHAGGVPQPWRSGTMEGAQRSAAGRKARSKVHPERGAAPEDHAALCPARLGRGDAHRGAAGIPRRARGHDRLGILDDPGDGREDPG